MQELLECNRVSQQQTWLASLAVEMKKWVVSACLCVFDNTLCLAKAQLVPASSAVAPSNKGCYYYCYMMSHAVPHYHHLVGQCLLHEAPLSHFIVVAVQLDVSHIWNIRTHAAQTHTVVMVSGSHTLDCVRGAFRYTLLLSSE